MSVGTFINRQIVMEKFKDKSRRRRASDANVLHDTSCQSQSLSDSNENLNMNRSISRSSFRASFRASRSKLDEFFKSPLDFNSKRKRARPDDDSVSLRSVDLNLDEPQKKRRSSLAKVTSLAALLSPVAPVKKVGSTLQKSLSVWTLKSQKVSSTYKDPLSFPTPPRRRRSTYWHETVHVDDIRRLDKRQIDRQEAIFELQRSEEDLVEDILMVKSTYHDSMKKLGLMTDAELSGIFGHIDLLVPVHQDLIEQMKLQRQSNGVLDNVGDVLVKWVPKLETYVTYCANQVSAKAILDLKKQDAQIGDFLERCQESPFSRHLDLWNFLDVPRSRLVKYPLLLKTIQKHTSDDHRDIMLIDEALTVLDRIIRLVDIKTGEAKCEFIKKKLRYIDDNQRCQLIDISTVILCDGQLKNARGTNLFVCLFEKVLVLTRSVVRDGIVQYQIYRDPLPVNYLTVEDLKDGSTHGGSFKSVFTPNQSVRNAFRITSSADVACALVLQANDDLDKRHWIQCIKDAISQNSDEQIIVNVGYCSPLQSCHESPVICDSVPVMRRRIKPESPLSSPVDHKALSPSSSANIADTFNPVFCNSLKSLDGPEDLLKP